MAEKAPRNRRAAFRGSEPPYVVGKEPRNRGGWLQRLTVRLGGRRTIEEVKLLFVPFAIVAFVLFLLLLGAIGLMISMGVLAFFGKIWRGAMRR
jgi:hypothetical protein